MGSKIVTGCDSVSHSHFHHIDHIDSKQGCWFTVITCQNSCKCPRQGKMWLLCSLQSRSDYMPGFKRYQTTYYKPCNVCQEVYWLFNECSSTLMLAFYLVVFLLTAKENNTTFSQAISCNECVCVALFCRKNVFVCIFHKQMVNKSKHLVFPKIFVFTQLMLNAH